MREDDEPEEEEEEELGHAETYAEYMPMKRTYNILESIDLLSVLHLTLFSENKCHVVSQWGLA